jgi:hypothetical protein
MALRRRPSLPADVAVHLAPREHVLAAAPLAPDVATPSDAPAWAAATGAGVVVLDRTGVRWRRAWTDVDHGSWAEATDTLTITWVDGGPATALVLAPQAGRWFPEVFRDRVQASVVHVERRTVPGLGEVRAIVRRSPDDTLFSQLVAPGSRDLTPREQDEADALEAQARRAVGLPA